MIESHTIIGIDPDVDRSGVATLNTATRELKIAGMTFAELTDLFFRLKMDEEMKRFQDGFAYRRSKMPVVIIEAGYLNKSNWHIKKGDSSRRSAAIGRNVGRNHEVAMKIAEMARHNFLKVREVRPLKKLWKGRDNKITKDELDSLMQKNGFGVLSWRVSQDCRDAALLAIFHSGIPIKL